MQPNQNDLELAKKFPSPSVPEEKGIPVAWRGVGPVLPPQASVEQLTAYVVAQVIQTYNTHLGQKGLPDFEFEAKVQVTLITVDVVEKTPALAALPIKERVKITWDAATQVCGQLKEGVDYQ